MTRQAQSEQSDDRIMVDVRYRLSFTVEKAEEIVGRPWTTTYPDDDSFTCDLEERVKDRLPDLLADHVMDEPDVELWG